MKKSEIRFNVPVDVRNELKIKAIQANKTLNKFLLDNLMRWLEEDEKRKKENQE